MTSKSRRQRLRDATDTVHQRLDTMVSEGSFLKDLGGYREYLQRTHRARTAIERALDENGAKNYYPAWPNRRLSDLLLDDLVDLGISPAPSLPAPQKAYGKGGVLGALYVLEGSSLGARLIERRVSALGISPQRGGRHLSAQTNDPAAFRAFLDRLEACELDDESDAECLTSAVETFACFERCYAGHSS